MQSLVVKPVVPTEMMVPPIVSTSKHILRNRLEAITPITSASQYSFDTNSRLEFIINSSGDMINFNRSFLRFDLACSVTNGTANSISLATGGGHSLFSEIRVEASNGTIFQRIRGYNRFYAMYSQSFSQEYVEQTGWAYGDSVGPGDVTHLYGSSTDGARNYTALSSHTLCLKPLIPLFNTGMFFPVNFIRGGIRIVFELDNPEYVLSIVGDGGGDYSSAMYTISNPRYITNFIQPSEDIVQQYMNLYNSGGISIRYSDFQTFEQNVPSGSSGSFSYSVQPTVRSARNVFLIQQNLRHRTITAGSAADNASTYTADSIGTFVKANLSAYQFYSGALRFPLAQSVVTTDSVNAEPFQYFQQAIGTAGSLFATMRCNVEEWSERSSDSGNTDSTKFILAAKLGRGEDSYSGLDLGSNPLTFLLDYDDTYSVNSVSAIRYVMLWIEADATMTISTDGVLVRT